MVLFVVAMELDVLGEESEDPGLVLATPAARMLSMVTLVFDAGATHTTDEATLSGSDVNNA